MGFYNFIRLILSNKKVRYFLMGIITCFALLGTSKVFAATNVTLDFDYENTSVSVPVTLNYDNYNLIKTYNDKASFYRLLNWSSTDTPSIYGSFRDNYRTMTLRYANNNFFQNAEAYIYDANTNTFNKTSLVNGRDLTIGNTTAFTSSNPATMVSLQKNANIYLNNSAETNWLTNANGLLGSAFTNPFIVNDTYIPSWSFDFLQIDLGSVPLTDTIGGSNNFTLTTDYSSQYATFDFDIDCMDYLDTSTKVISIPRSVILNNFITTDFTTEFNLYVRGYGIIDSYSLGTYTIQLTQAQVDAINGQNSLDNEDRNTQQVVESLDNVTQTIEETNEKVEHLLDTNVDTNSVSSLFNISEDLNAPDGSHIDDFFIILYNAFCYDSVVNVTFTLPFVNKQVVISSANVSSFYPQALKDIVSIIAWGGIALFIAKDIRSMINKINEGRPEYIGHDIKKEVL